MVLVMSSPDSAEALCPEGVLHMLQLALAGSQVLQPVRGVVLEGGGPGGLAVDLQGNGQSRRSHTGRSKARAVKIKEAHLQKEAAGTWEGSAIYSRMGSCCRCNTRFSMVFRGFQLSMQETYSRCTPQSNE